jgi:putative glycosyltransferase (TIGR04348 family)
LKIYLFSPKLGSVRTGNQCTARQWAAVFESLGHDVVFSDDGDSELMIALHASKSQSAIVKYREGHPGRGVILALTGTDIYPEPDGAACTSMYAADALVVLQSRALDRIPDAFRHKARVIVQSVQRMQSEPEETNGDTFVVSVVGHLRDVKDPMRAAAAARRLPPDSKVQIEHAGAIIDPKYEEIVAREREENARYTYLGEQSSEGVLRLIRRGQVMVLSSLSEGGARVIGESIVEGTPVVATRIDGVTGLVGDDYPGLFSAADTEELAALLNKVETDAGFRRALHHEVKRLTPRFDPALEREAWRALIDELAN